MKDDISSSSPEKVTSNNPLEQFVLLAKSAKGAAAVELIKQVLEAPGVHVFGELLDMPHIAELQGTPNAKYYNLLHIFAYGTYRQYLERKAELLDLTPVQKKKLQHLTIVTIATKNKCIAYAKLLEELDIMNVRDLEDLIIEAIYSDIIQGKLDQRNSQLEVDFAIGRDVPASDIGSITSTLQEWCDSCEATLTCVETQIIKANADKARRIKHKEAIEQEVGNIKKTLKTSHQDGDDAMPVESREAMVAQSGDKNKKQLKLKAGLRGSSSKFWQK